MYWQLIWWPQPLEMLQLGSVEAPQTQQGNLEELALQERLNPADKEGSMEKEQAIFFSQFAKLLKDKYEKPQKKTWTEEEDELLLSMANNGDCWEKINNFIQGASPQNCQRRFERLRKVHQKWPKELDNYIKDLVEAGPPNWVLISKQVKQCSEKFRGYTSKMIRQRYKNYLKPGIERRAWNFEDDMKVIRLIQNKGLNWQEIEGSLKTRSELEIKNRYYGILEPLVKKAKRNCKAVMKRKQVRELLRHS